MKTLIQNIVHWFLALFTRHSSIKLPRIKKVKKDKKYYNRVLQHTRTYGPITITQQFKAQEITRDFMEDCFMIIQNQNHSRKSLKAITELLNSTIK